MEVEDATEDRVESVCWELLSESEHQPFLRHLFTQVPAGCWEKLREENIYVTWLEVPGGPDEGFRLVLFVHSKSDWTMTATYNIARLLRFDG